MSNKIIVMSISSVIIILVAIFFVRLGLGEPEDEWRCEGGQWVKHGNPFTHAPASACGEISWEQAQKMIRACEVSRVFQTKEKRVDFVLKNGKYANSVEPGYDAVLQEVYNSRADCGEVGVVNE